MPIETNGLSHMALRVTDLERAASFYRDVLGFQPVLEGDGLVLLNARGTLIGLRGGASETRSGDRFDPFRVGLDHAALAVEDRSMLDAMRRHLDEAGVPNNGVQRDEATGAEQVTFYDADGIAWELYALPAQA